MLPELGLFDFCLAFLYLCLIYFGAFLYKNKKIETNPEYKYFILGLTAKIIGGIGFALIYLYYYKGGDTFGYFDVASKLAKLFLESPIDYVNVLIKDTYSDINFSQYNIDLKSKIGSEEWVTIRILSFFNLFSFNNYLLLTIVLCLITYIGNWKLFQLFVKLTNVKEGWIAIACFFIPSMVFWGGGVLKDTVAFFALCLFFNSISQIIFLKQKKLIHFVSMIIFFLLCFNVKSYIILSFVPSLMFGAFVFYKAKIRNIIIRLMVTPILFLIMGLIIYSSVLKLSEESDKYQLEKLENRIKGFHSWHTHQGGSSYDLGVEDFEVSTIIQKIPVAINVTFFRPYFWEARNVVVIIGALESFVFFMLFLLSLKSFIQYLFFGKKLSFIFTIALTFSLILGFSVGFTSYNFGALARYKIPCLPFAFLALGMLVSENNKFNLGLQDRS
jgi:hypothetical protein